MQNETAKCKSLQSPPDIWALLFGISVEVKSRDWLKTKHIIHCFAYIPTVPLREELLFVCWDRCKAALHVIHSLRGNNLSFLSAQGVDFDFVSQKWSCAVPALKFPTPRVVSVFCISSILIPSSISSILILPCNGRKMTQNKK